MNKPVYDLKELGKMSPSEVKQLEYYEKGSLYNLLYACRSSGGYLLLYVERKTVRKTDKHEPPFKYFRAVITKRGKQITRYSGNIWDAEEQDIIDDFCVVHSR